MRGAINEPELMLLLIPTCDSELVLAAAAVWKPEGTLALPPPRAEKADRGAERRSGPAGELAEALPVAESERDGHEGFDAAVLGPSRDTTAAGDEKVHAARLTRRISRTKTPKEQQQRIGLECTKVKMKM